MLLNCGVGEDSWESLGLQGVQPVNPKEINREYSLEGLMLKLQYFGHLMQRTKSLEKTLMLGKIEDKRRRGQQDEMIWSHHQLNGHEFEQALGVDDGQGSLACCSPWGCKELDTTERLNWTEVPGNWVPSLVSLTTLLVVTSLFSEIWVRGVLGGVTEVLIS